VKLISGCTPNPVLSIFGIFCLFPGIGLYPDSPLYALAWCYCGRLVKFGTQLQCPNVHIRAGACLDASVLIFSLFVSFFTLLSLPGAFLAESMSAFNLAGHG